MSQDITYRNIRITKSSVFREYLSNTQLWQKIGNGEFAKLVRTNALTGNAASSAPGSLSQEYTLYHSWLPGSLGTSEAGANLARDLIRGLPEHEFNEGHRQVSEALIKLGWCIDAPVDLDCLVQKTQTSIIAIQNKLEQKTYLDMVRAKRPKVVMEIGTARGGMLYCFSQLAAPDADIISVDLPGAPNCGGQTDTEREFYATFGPETQRFHFIPANSLLRSTKAKVSEILNGRKIDLLFIDGDHSAAGVRSDFEMYREFVAEDGLLTLHDICLLPENWGAGNEVGLFWRDVKQHYQTQEIIDTNGSFSPHNPENKPYAWGIGLIGAALPA